ncbi:hypothetical protein [Variovorax sp. OV329]|uniref:hypothetical protein n=1 Tax=Variovorax sp. OV329 TaxID=1882825 RepID=UPI0008DF1937|nr:hypothetical protein [Variovorax sp. OV329]SFM10464.1 hypothetical protein SAMN05444747_102463 [Variovorax sp. OV329]
MSVEFLRQVAATPLPRSYNAKQDVDAIKVLRQAGLVLAMVNEPPEGGARVFAVTDKGREELLRIHYPESPKASRSRGFRLPQVALRARDALKRSIGPG